MEKEGQIRVLLEKFQTRIEEAQEAFSDNKERGPSYAFGSIKASSETLIEKILEILE